MRQTPEGPSPHVEPEPVLLPEQIRCPKCGRGFWLKPLYNSVDECMVCRWHRNHPNESQHKHEWVEGPTGGRACRCGASRRPFPA